jgi:hypothetical protein
MGKSWTLVYQVGRYYTFNNVVYLAISHNSDDYVTFKKWYDKYLDVNRFNNAKEIIKRKQQYREDR